VPPTGSRGTRRQPQEGRRHPPPVGSLEGALADGRFATIADDLRLYRKIADGRVGAAADPRGTPPDWTQAARYAGAIGLGALAGRLEERADAP
jgi:hypothetical protein